jgi:hypothetical protein
MSDMEGKYQDAVLRKLKDGRFIETPLDTVFLSFRISDTTAVNIHFENGKLYIHAGGIGRKKISIDPIEPERIALVTQDLPPVTTEEGESV